MDTRSSQLGSALPAKGYRLLHIWWILALANYCVSIGDWEKVSRAWANP